MKYRFLSGLAITWLLIFSLGCNQRGNLRKLEYDFYINKSDGKHQLIFNDTTNGKETVIYDNLIMIFWDSSLVVGNDGTNNYELFFNNRGKLEHHKFPSLKMVKSYYSKEISPIKQFDNMYYAPDVYNSMLGVDD
jgi:hypothetical protein